MKAPKFLKSRKAIISIGCLVLVTLVWLVLGWWLDQGAMVCLIATCVVLVLFILYLVLEQAFQKKQSEQLEKSIWEQSEDQKMAVSPGRREEIENLRQELSSSIQKLKKSKLGNGRSGASALYALPWYMIIGPPAAGKTTAIRNSGLEFPFGTDHEIQGVGGTRNCDWWFSSSAILLDTAGRYTTEDDDREEWTAFLDILKKNRRRQPMNGVLVCISIADLISARKDELDWHARTIRKRIDELIQQLGIRFPVYVVFTKCDLLNGFVDFFEDFSRAQREQVWGCTLTGEQQQDQKPRAVFDSEFQLLYDSLISTRLARLSPGIQREGRSRIFAFPMEFLAVKENLSYFVGNVFQPNPYQESPMFRGFYFTSGTQEGVPIDKVVASIAQAFGLAPEITEQFNPEIQTKSYFIKNLFTDIVIPDDKLVRPSSRSGKGIRFARIALVSTVVMGLLLFLLGVAQAYFRSKAVVDETGAVIKSLPSGRTERLDVLLNRIRSLQNPPFFVFGMDRSAKLLEPIERLYLQQLLPIVQSSYLNPLQQRLRDPRRKQSDLSEDLKAYLLLTTEHKRLNEDTLNQVFLSDELSKTIDPSTSTSLNPHLTFFAREFENAVHDGVIQTFPQDESLVKLARSYAGKFNVTGTYEALKRKLGAFPPYRAPSQLFAANSEVRGIFTKEGLQSFEQAVKDFGGINDEAKWVLDYQEDQLQGMMRDQSKVADSLRGMYSREYADEWWNFLLNLSVVPSENLNDASNQLRQLGDPQKSPIRKLFDDVLANTRFEKGTLDKFVEKAGKAVSMKTSANPIEIQFKFLHQFIWIDPEKGQPSELDGLIAQLGRLADELDALGEPKDAKKFAQAILGGSGSLPQVAKQIQSSLKPSDERTRRSISGLFMLPLRFAWRGVLSRAAEYINDEWHVQVVEPYRRLSSAYPFDPGAQVGVAPNELADVFADGGALSKFVDMELRPFFDPGDSWDAKKWEGEGFQLSSTSREALAQGKTLSQSLFRGKELGMKVNITLESPVPEGDVHKVCLEIGGEQKCFEVEDGKKTFSFDWPGGGGAVIRLMEKSGLLGTGLFASEGEIDKLSFDGDWGLFKLISVGKQAVKGVEVRCKWRFKDDVTLSATVRTDKGSANPFGRSMSVALPERLL